jgi:methionyl-tRNA synthetase
MYCPLDEAWPDYNLTQINNADHIINRSHDHHIETIDTKTNETRPELVSHKIEHMYDQKNEHITDQRNEQSVDKQLESPYKIDKQEKNKCDCGDLLYHIEHCDECKKLMANKYSHNKISDLFVSTPQLRETIVVFLVGILILMLLNLFYK